MLLPDPPRVAHQDEATVVATWRTAVLTLFGHRPLSPAGAEAQVTVCAEHGRYVGERRMVEIVLLDPHVPFIGKETRAVFEEGAPRVGPYYACVGTVFESRGFRAVVIRGILRSLQLASRNEFDQQVFASTRACVDWVLPRATAAGSRTYDGRELFEAISWVRGYAQQAGIFYVP